MSAGLPAGPELAERAAGIAAQVRRALLDRQGDGETLVDPGDLKSAHAIDGRATAVARAALADTRCNLLIEGEATEADPAADFCVYLDPVDGSLNWERGIGDPAFVLAAAPGPRAERLDDLVFSWVEGLRSGDRYWTDGGGARFRCALSGRESRLRTSAPKRVAGATGYLRAGYGGARRQLAVTLPLYLAARDLRAVDNAATELAEIARGAAHFLVEARGLSDGFNLLAWPLVRAAGGALRDLEGGALAQAPFDPAAAVDYVLASNAALAADVLDHIHGFAASGRATLEALMERAG